MSALPPDPPRKGINFNPTPPPAPLTRQVPVPVRDWTLVYRYQLGPMARNSGGDATLTDNQAWMIRNGVAEDWLNTQIEWNMLRENLHLRPRVFLVDRNDSNVKYDVTPPPEFIEQVSHWVDDFTDFLRTATTALVGKPGEREALETPDISAFYGEEEALALDAPQPEPDDVESDEI